MSEIRRIEVARIVPGDTLIVTLADDVDDATAEFIKRQVLDQFAHREYVPPVLVATSRSSIGVYRVQTKGVE